MGEAGNKPRKFRQRLPKVPRGAEANDIHLAGLTNSAEGPHGNRLDHEAAKGRSENVGKFAQFILRHMGRYPKEQEQEQEQEQ